MVKMVGAFALPGVTVGGLKLPVAPGGSALADMVTTLPNVPPTGSTVTLILTDPPSATVTVAGEAFTVNVVFTVSLNAEEVEPTNATLPVYTAVILSAPAGKVVLENAATPDELTLPLPRRVVPL